MEEIKQAAIHFEAIKVSMNQNKEGMALRLNIHPNDCPQELLSDWVGTRYMVAMVRLTDDDRPDTREDQREIERMITSAGMLCRNEDFYQFMFERSLCDFATEQEEMEKECVEGLKKVCGIKSRADLRSDVSARKMFEYVREEFKQWKKGQP
jgi:hypothetical protein